MSYARQMPDSYPGTSGLDADVPAATIDALPPGRVLRHQDCRVCAAACRRCEQACRNLLDIMN